MPIVEALQRPSFSSPQLGVTPSGPIVGCREAYGGENSRIVPAPSGSAVAPEVGVLVPGVVTVDAARARARDCVVPGVVVVPGCSTKRGECPAPPVLVSMTLVR